MKLFKNDFDNWFSCSKENAEAWQDLEMPAFMSLYDSIMDSGIIQIKRILEKQLLK